MDLKKRLGKRIQDLRLKNGLKQSELAEKTEIATKTQSCIETGKNYPSADTIEKYAKALNVDVSDILDLGYTKTKKELFKEINHLLQKASDSDVQKAYRVLKGLLL